MRGRQSRRRDAVGGVLDRHQPLEWGGLFVFDEVAGKGGPRQGWHARGPPRSETRQSRAPMNPPWRQQAGSTWSSSRAVVTSVLVEQITTERATRKVPIRTSCKALGVSESW